MDIGGLVRKIREGDGEAFAALYEETRRSVYYPAYSVCRDKYAAETVMQDTFVKFYENIGAVDDAAYAAAVVRDYGRRGYGPAKVREELRRRGVPRELWDAAMEELPDSGAVLDALIQKKCRGELSDPREIKRVSDSLLRRGLSWGEVHSALSR